MFVYDLRDIGLIFRELGFCYYVCMCIVLVYISCIIIFCVLLGKGPFICSVRNHRIIRNFAKFRSSKTVARIEVWDQAPARQKRFDGLGCSYGQSYRRLDHSCTSHEISPGDWRDRQSNASTVYTCHVIGDDRGANAMRIVRKYIRPHAATLALPELESFTHWAQLFLPLLAFYGGSAGSRGARANWPASPSPYED